MFIVEMLNAGKWVKDPLDWASAGQAQRRADALEHAGGIARVVDERPAGFNMVKGFYVTFRDAGRTAWAFGPFVTHREALDAVKTVADRLYELKPESHFWSRGTSSQQAASWDDLPAGVLNADPSLSQIALSRPKH